MRARGQFDSHQKGPNSGHFKTVKLLAQYLWPQQRTDLRIRVLAALFFLILAKLLNVYVPFLLKATIDSFAPEFRPLAVPLGLIMAYGLARFLVQFFGEARDFLFAKVAQHAQRAIALRTFQHLHQLSLDFHLSRQTGGLSRVIERGTKGIQFVLNFMTFNILPTIFEIFLVTIIMIGHFNLAYAAVIFLTISLYIFLTLAVTEWRIKHRQNMNQAESKANTRAIDSLLNYETVKYFNNEEHEHGRFDRSLQKYEQAALKSQLGLSLLNTTQSAVIGLGLIVIMTMAAKGIVRGDLGLGDFVLVNTYLIQLYLPLNFLGFAYREIKNGLVDMDKMFELMKVHASVADRPGAPDLSIQKGEIEFENVHFSYGQNRPILSGVSFKIGAGKTLAIVGPSGSGKSTIARLLFRFYDVDHGAIKIDGQDIREVTQNSLRSQMGVVPQDTVLFNDTIGYNIRYGRPNASQSEVDEAARLAGIHRFIESLPEGYDTQVGERGLKLSGGEKQRTAIARTILKNPSILIFDEATSALDSHKEKEIQAALKKISLNRSTLVIAHRLSTIVDADEILVLKDGQVIERGRHQELLAQSGEYASLWQKQQQAKDERSAKLNEEEGSAR